MYEKFYGLREKPFSLTPDPKFLYLSKHHQGALDHMLYGIQQKEGFMAITGDVGTGKTTICRCLLDRLGSNIHVALILNPMISEVDLLRTCLHDLRVNEVHSRQGSFATASISSSPEEHVASPDSASRRDFSWINKLSKKELLDTLNSFLLQQHKEDKSTILIIDEAQNLSLDVLELSRILSNLETEKEKLIQIIFVGQLELNDKLNLPELKQLNQRISIRYKITPLPKEETRNYISHRLMVAGASSRICFTKSSLNEIYNYSQGYPRLTNLACDRALLAGFNAQADTIDGRHVKEGIRSLLGDEEKNYFILQFFKNRLPLAASILFFLAGLVFFLMAGGGPTAPEPDAVSTHAKNRDSSSSDQSSRAVRESVKISPKPVSLPASAINASEAGGYRIQVYAFSKKNSAERNARELRTEGYETYWRQVKSSRNTLFVVYVGPFGDITSARKHITSLKQSGREPILLSIAEAGQEEDGREPDRR